MIRSDGYDYYEINPNDDGNITITRKMSAPCSVDIGPTGGPGGYTEAAEWKVYFDRVNNNNKDISCTIEGSEIQITIIVANKEDILPMKKIIKDTIKKAYAELPKGREAVRKQKEQQEQKERQKARYKDELQQKYGKLDDDE